MQRLQVIKHHVGSRRAFAAAVLPVALYASEHDAWGPKQLQGLLAAAVRGCRAHLPGVPHSLSGAALPASLDPRFRVPCSAIDRLAREIWHSTGPERSRPADALTGQELFLLHRKLLRDPGPKLTRGPGRALLDALQSLRLNWELPHRISANAAASDDYPVDCTCMAPDLVRKFAERHFLEDRRQSALSAIAARHDALKDDGTILTLRRSEERRGVRIYSSVF